MKKFFLLAVVLALSVYGYVQEQGLLSSGSSLSKQRTGSAIQYAYENRQSDLQVKGEGIVTKILADDVKGSKHQKFILRLSSGNTLLIAHNIDLAKRVNRLKNGDKIEFYGEYEWNPRGGVLHWTHHDPSGRHIGGWLKHKGTVYH